MEENTSIIYGVKANGKYHYIGKKRKQEKINNSDITVQYNKEDLRDIFIKNDVAIIQLKEVNEDWFGEKIHEIVKKYKDNNPLINPQWMLEGKRSHWEGTGGYWEGKTRDANTIQRLSESKFKRIVQFDINGYHVKTWDSIKEVAIEIFNDYQVINGSAKSRIYSIIKGQRIETRFNNNSYWFKEEELIKHFGLIPKKINIGAIKNEQKKKKSTSNKNRKLTHTKRKQVIHYNVEGNIINTYDNYYHAAYVLKISIRTVQRICRGDKKVKNDNYILKYGKRTNQKINIKYPEYELNYIPEKKEPKQPTYIKTKTRTQVIQYDIKGNYVHTFDDVIDASNKLKLKENRIRYICAKGITYSKGSKKKKHYLKFGKKIQTKKL